MSQDARLFIALAIGCVTGALLLAPAPAVAQYQSTSTYVCQTPSFWCAFVWSRGVANGTTCYCNTYAGAVFGYSIDPSGVADAPTLPKPQSPTDIDTPARPAPSEDPEVASDDCYKGLGNCQGSFMASLDTNDRSSEGRTTRTARPSRVSSRFAEALQDLIDAADDEFSDVQGEEGRGTSLSDSYSVTVVPEGFDRCELLVPHRTTRSPSVHCFSDTMRYRTLLELVTGALGPSDEQTDDELLWFVEGAEVAIFEDDGEAGLAVRVR